MILNLVHRSPREIKRVVNSALMAGEGIEMSSRNWAEGAAPPTLAQGIQVELIHRILRDRFQRETLLGSEQGNAFFGQWSGIVCATPDEERVYEMQTRGGGIWNLLGSFQMAPGQNHRIELAAADGKVIADGIQFTPVELAAPKAT